MAKKGTDARENEFPRKAFQEQNTLFILLKQQQQQAIERTEILYGIPYVRHKLVQTSSGPSTVPHIPLGPQFKSSGKGLNI